MITMGDTQQQREIDGLYGEMEEGYQVLLAWRVDPEESFSDWKIQVTRISGEDDDESCQTYHVHKYFLGVGPRRTSFFNGVFHASHLDSSKTGVTLLKLEESAADSFPAFLDYVYGFNDVDVTTESAVALRHLSIYFGVPSLYQSVSDFLEQDFSECNVHMYCREALLYHDSEIVDVCMQIAAMARRELLGSPVDKTDASPAQLTMQMLSMEQQNRVLQYALQESAEESKRVQGTPSSWGRHLLTATVRPFLWNSKT
jgi:hypothetical protein